MKKTALTALIVLMSLPMFGQKNEVEVGVFSPVMTASMNKFFNDFWILYPSTNHSRKYLSLGYSLSYQRKFKSFSLGYTFGYVTRHVKENNTLDDSQGFPMREDYEYKQRHYVNTLSFIKEEQFKNLSFRLRAEIPFIYYGKGTNDYSYREYYDTEYEYTRSSYEVVGGGFAVGFGLGLGVFYNLSKKFYLGVEVSEYLLFTKFNQPSTLEQSDYYSYSDELFEYSREGVTNYQQIGFSRVVPHFKVGYKF